MKAAPNIIAAVSQLGSGDSQEVMVLAGDFLSATWKCRFQLNPIQVRRKQCAWRISH